MIVHDVTLTLDESTFRWPGDPAPELARVRSIEAGDAYNLSVLAASAHAGTHVDAALHFVDGAADVSVLPLDILIGPAYVVDVTDMGVVDASELARRVPRGTERLMLRTREHGAVASAAGLTVDAAEWLIGQGICLVAMDGPSVDASGSDGFPVHEILLKAGVVIVENCELGAISPGLYQLVCAPLKWRGAEGAPARVLLLQP